MKTFIVPFPIHRFGEKPLQIEYKIQYHQFYLFFEFSSHRLTVWICKLPSDFMNVDFIKGNNNLFKVDLEKEEVIIKIEL